MHDTFLFQAFVFLVASLIAVPIAKRLGLGSVLGYLIAGAVIGPFGLKLLPAPGDLQHVSEFGVVIMLFLIGLELNPQLLWRMRAMILGLGGAQVAAAGAALTLIAMAAGLDWRAAIAAGFTLSLSSTAIVMQSLREKGLAQADSGRAAFAVLLFQDLAVIPMLALFPLLTIHPVVSEAPVGIAALPTWLQPAVVVAAVLAVVIAGRLLTRPLFRYIAATNSREVFAVAALSIVVGVALLMQSVGLSPALGAFVAGVVLADSEFRHELTSDIEPFRAILLGLFFISVGAGIDFALILSKPFVVLGVVAGLIAIKAAALFGVARLMRRPLPDAAMIALALAQGGEFAFVLFGIATRGGVFDAATADLLIAAVALSMALTPLLIIAAQRAAQRFANAPRERAAPERIETETPDALIAGYGRFGQVVSRLLNANGFETSILELNAEQVELVRTFGAKANFGDASRVEMLEAAGAADAKVLVIAIDDQDKAVEMAEIARQHFPHLKIVARAYDRRHAFELMKRNVDAFERETFEGALRLGSKALKLLGFYAHRAERAAGLFRRHDERQVIEMAPIYSNDDFDAYRTATVARQGMIEEAMRRDLARHNQDEADDGWDTESLDEEAAKRA